MNLPLHFDGFFWFVFFLALAEGVRIVRSERARDRRPLRSAFAYGLVEILVVSLAAATTSLVALATLGLVRMGIVTTREREFWRRGWLEAGTSALALVVLAGAAGADRFSALESAVIAPAIRLLVVGLLCLSCLLAIVPVRLRDAAKETLSAPMVMTAFARAALPVGASLTHFDVVVPTLAVLLSLVCALWLLSAGMRANHFEPSTLVAELVVCERGVLLAFVWLGLSAAELHDLAGVGALLAWWSSALGLIALESSLHRNPLPKPKAFFSLAMVVGLPGTVGFIGEDLLANGLLEVRPALAAAFVCVAAINAAALYLALANLLVDLGPTASRERTPSPMMLTAAGLSVFLGLVPQPFVTTAIAAHAAITHPSHHGHASGPTAEGAGEPVAP